MSAHRLSPGVFAAILAFSLSTAAAEPAPFAPPPAPSQELLLDLGAGSPLGFGGISYSVSPIGSLRIELGVGYGITGAQFLLMPKLVQSLAYNTDILFGLGPSLSLLPLDKTNYASEFHKTGVATWLNGELSAEHRLIGSHLVITVAAGLAVGLTSNYLLDIGGDGIFLPAYQTTRASILPEARVGIGVAW